MTELPEKFITLGELSERTGIIMACLKRMADEKKLPCLNVNRRRLFQFEEVMKVLTIQSIINMESGTTMSDLDLIIKLSKERDEVRRMYCVMASGVLYKSTEKITAEHIADSKNWDCYKTETQEETQ